MVPPGAAELGVCKAPGSFGDWVPPIEVSIPFGTPPFGAAGALSSIESFSSEGGVEPVASAVDMMNCNARVEISELFRSRDEQVECAYGDLKVGDANQWRAYRRVGT